MKQAVKGARTRQTRAVRERPSNLEEARRLWRAFAAEQGLNTSKARDAVVEVFFGMKDHASLQDLFDKARRQHAGVSFATVYRTMKLLDEAGLADARNFGDGKSTLYEVAAGRGHHDHLICDSCGRIVEFVDDEVEALQDQIARRYGFSLLRHRHELYGLCADCRRPSR
jgi:Fur family ferric uptake transcriptional regulator